jgi:hypothetical protein
MHEFGHPPVVTQYKAAGLSPHRGKLHVPCSAVPSQESDQQNQADNGIWPPNIGGSSAENESSWLNMGEIIVAWAQS